MSPLLSLVSFGLRQVIGEPADGLVSFLEQRFTDHSQALPKALSAANERAWQTLAIALAGESLLGQITKWIAPGEERAFAGQLRLFLKNTPDHFQKAPEEFRKHCLAELRRARGAGWLSSKNLSYHALANRAATFQRFTDPKGLVDGAEQIVGQISASLASECPNLARLLRKPTPSGTPLLVAAFAYFFRREVETNEELAHGLHFENLRQLSTAHAQAFAEVDKALQALGQQFEQVFEQLDRIETAVVETQAAAQATHGAVLDMQAELQRLASQNLIANAETRRLLEDVLNRVSQVGMQKGEVKPQYSCSIRSQDEREAVRRLLDRFRHLPAEQQKQVPALLNGLGKLQIGSGDFEGARQTFVEVVRTAPENSAKAEAAFNAYRAALEQKQWPEALKGIQAAARLDSQRFSPFQLHRYEPKRILGAGGFGTAFLCHDRNFGVDVVVKTLHSGDLERTVDDVFREARMLHQLSHSAIIQVKDCEYADPIKKSRPYLVMNFFPGTSLETFIQQHGTLSPNDLVVVARQIAEGMRAAHQQGILHRDLKPANVLVRKEGEMWEVKIIDFGLALRQQAIDTSIASHSSGHSILSSSVAGTLDYAPPEQMGKLPGVKPGPYSDVYAFGKLCCYALFKLTEPKTRHWASIPKDLADMLEKCIDQELEHRHASFDSVLQVLERLNSNRATEIGSQPPVAQDKYLAGQKSTQEEQRRVESVSRDPASFQMEGEARLAQLVRDALERTQGKFTPEDNAAAKELVRRYQINPERARQIVNEIVREVRTGSPGPRPEKPLEVADKTAQMTDSIVASAAPGKPPSIADEVPQFYLPLSSPARPVDALGLLYRTRVLAVVEVIFQNAKLNLYHPKMYRLLANAPNEGQSVAWHLSERIETATSGEASNPANWEEVPESLVFAKKFKAFEKGLVDYLAADARLILYENKKLGLTSNPGDDPVSFVDRCRAAARKEAEKALAEEKNKYWPKFAALGAKLMDVTFDPNLEKDPVFTLTRGAPKLDGAERVARLEQEWCVRVLALLDTWRRAANDCNDQVVKPLKKNIQVTQMYLAWAPFWRIRTAQGVEERQAY